MLSMIRTLKILTPQALKDQSPTRHAQCQQCRLRLAMAELDVNPFIKELEPPTAHKLPISRAPAGCVPSWPGRAVHVRGGLRIDNFPALPHARLTEQQQLLDLKTLNFPSLQPMPRPE